MAQETVARRSRVWRVRRPVMCAGWNLQASGADCELSSEAMRALPIVPAEPFLNTSSRKKLRAPAQTRACRYFSEFRPRNLYAPAGGITTPWSRIPGTQTPDEYPVTEVDMRRQ